MASADDIDVEVAYAAAHRQITRTLTLPAGSSVEQAIRASGLLAEFPEIDLYNQRVGVFGEFVNLDDRLHGGDDRRKHEQAREPERDAAPFPAWRRILHRRHAGRGRT